MSEVIEKEVVTVLPKKVTIKASRKHTWLPEGHDGSHRFSKTAEHLTVQVDRHTNTLITGLTEEDEKRLEKKLNLSAGSLSKNKGKYWEKFKVVIPQSGVVLQPSTILADEIAYKVMLVHQEVANSSAGNARGEFPFARYVMNSEEEETETTNKEINLKLEAYKRLGEMTETEKRNFLKVYGKAAGRDSSTDFVTAQVGKIVDSEPKYFLDTVSDPNYKAHVFIKDCLANGILKESGGKYIRHGGDVLAYSLLQLVDFLQNKDNSEVTASLKAQLQAVK